MADRSYLLDTSALLTLRSDEAGADYLQRLLAEAGRGRCQVQISFMSRMEMLYLIGREEGTEAALQALRLLDLLAIEWVSCEPDILEAAAGLKLQGGLSVADSWIGATSIIRGSTLVHKDPEFVPFSQIDQHFLESSPAGA